MTKHWTLALALSLAPAAVACGGAPKPNDQLVASEAAIRAAEVAEAEGVPRAKLHLKHARDQVSEAKELMAKGKNDEARLVLNRARVDAELALSIARLESEKDAARKQLKRINELTAGE